MYGYIRYCRDEMKVKYIKLYDKYYCLLCTELDNNVGFFYQILTSYDITAFMLFFDSVLQENKNEYQIRCPFSKRKNCTVIVSSSAVDFSVLLSLFMASQKIEDNCMDEKSAKWKLIRSIIEKNKKFQDIIHDDYIEKWKSLLSDYYSAEKDENCNFDRLINLIGKAYGEVFKDFFVLNHLDYNLNNIYKLGCNIGKYIYFMDAYDDYFDDLKRKRFNPIIRMIDYKKIKENKMEIRKKSSFIIGIIINKLDALVNENFDIHSDEFEIFKNIIVHGMSERFVSISSKKYS